MAENGDSSPDRYVVPSIEGRAFTCMHCGVLAQQDWVHLTAGTSYAHYWRCRCRHCQGESIWNGTDFRMVDPVVAGGPPPHPDTPDDVKEDYVEARKIVALSARGACALLRLGLQKMCVHLGQSGNNINEDIKALVAAGDLPVEVQEALDALRVIGNNAVHPGEIDLRDDTDTATGLFELLNFIVDNRITQPKKRKALFEKLPEKAREAIKKRDEQQAAAS